MTYVIAFLEGIVTFLSPCLLPMLPIYVSYFAGEAEGDTARTLKNALGFVAGFSVVFLLLGIFAGTVGQLLSKHQTAVNVVSGAIVIVLGLNFMGVLKIPLLSRSFAPRANVSNLGFLSSVIFGMVFSIGWTPCVGVFLGSALAMVSQQGSIVRGIAIMLCYSLGLGIPFVVAAVLIDGLKSAFDVIKRNYAVINMVSGALLVLVGILMMTGYLNHLLSLMTF